MAKKKGRKIRIRQGNKANLPTLDVGEPAFTLDTKELYIGSADGNVNLSEFERAEASTTQKGISQLNDGISSTSTTESATPNAVKKVNDKIDTHQDESVASENGVHDFRYKNGVLQIKISGSWIDYISGNSGSGGSGNVTQAEKDSWNAKSDFNGDFNDLLNKPTIPSPIVLNDTLTSESTSEALTAKQGLALKSELDDITTVTNQHIGNISNPHNVTKSQVGLSDVDNVKQATKTEFDSHNEDNTIHITETERISWSNKAEKTYVDTKVSELVNSAPETLNILEELAEAIQTTDDVLDGLFTVIGTKASSADLTLHTNNSDMHITPTERTNWNGKAENTLATNATNGLISNSEKIKLASVSSDANFVEVLDELTSTSPTSALSAGKGKVISDKIDILTDETNTRLVNISDSVGNLNTTLTTHLDQSIKSFTKVFSRATNLAGDQIINIGFKPKMITAQAYLVSAANKEYMSIGSMSVENSTQVRIFAYPAGLKESGEGAILEIHTGNGSNAARCIVNDDNTITFSWLRAGTDLPSDTIIYTVSAW